MVGWTRLDKLDSLEELDNLDNLERLDSLELLESLGGLSIDFDSDAGGVDVGSHGRVLLHHLDLEGVDGGEVL